MSNTHTPPIKRTEREVFSDDLVQLLERYLRTDPPVFRMSELAIDIRQMTELANAVPEANALQIKNRNGCHEAKS